MSVDAEAILAHLGEDGGVKRTIAPRTGKPYDCMGVRSLGPQSRRR
jgi:hypothetical protein